MYKIYINERPLYFIETTDAKYSLPGSRAKPIFQYVEKKSQLKKAIKWLENKDFEEITFYHEKPQKIFKHFCKIVRPIEAGGGLVRNKEGKYFFIFRRGHWDLPKGKLDPGENFAEAAVREVAEETGLKGKIVQDLIMTYHMYIYKDAPALKVSKWFLMECEKDKIKLQADEDIDEGRFIELDKAIDTLKPMYISIKDVVLEALDVL